MNARQRRTYRRRRQGLLVVCARLRLAGVPFRVERTRVCNVFRVVEYAPNGIFLTGRVHYVNCTRRQQEVAVPWFENVITPAASGV